MEFKPERWIFKSGDIKNEPSYKFLIFNVGPRTCLGKNMALSQLKIVATTISYHYPIQLVEGHPVLPANSILLHMKAWSQGQSEQKKCIELKQSQISNGNNCVVSYLL
ncbi:putative cytochrome P450 [Helianthus annuus]|nr:putative cytochrome P450 [Helianthus annuus]